MWRRDGTRTYQHNDVQGRTRLLPHRRSRGVVASSSASAASLLQRRVSARLSLCSGGSPARCRHWLGVVSSKKPGVAVAEKVAESSGRRVAYKPATVACAQIC